MVALPSGAVKPHKFPSRRPTVRKQKRLERVARGLCSQECNRPQVTGTLCAHHAAYKLKWWRRHNPNKERRGSKWSPERIERLLVRLRVEEPYLLSDWVNVESFIREHSYLWYEPHQVLDHATYKSDNYYHVSTLSYQLWLASLNDTDDLPEPGTGDREPT